ncbi:MAG: N-acetylmuramoyl-L-alanine amidase [Thermoplasmata archaeon]|nr:N-acetylmuramoyl-L-alanine amidase [Thermoplasmata archaeon]
MIPDRIMMHHSLTADSGTVSWQAIRRYHKQELKWRDIGYHYGIEDINGEYEILVGRLMSEHGAHCRQRKMNRRSIGICLVGNFDEDPPPDEQWGRAVQLVRSLQEVLRIPREHVHGHREFVGYKSCPGRSFSMQEFRDELL